MRHANGPTSLYRFFDADDALLYVGITGYLPTRWTSHNRQKDWWTEVVRATVEHFDTRAAAEEAEIVAIQNELPRHNVKDRVRPDGPSGYRAVTCPDLLVRDVAALTQLPTQVVRDYAATNLIRAWWTGGGHARIEAASVNELLPLLKIPPGADRDQAFAALRARNRGETPAPE